MSHVELFGREDLRYGYFWPFANTPKVIVSDEQTLEDVDREMDGRDTLKDIPVFAMRVIDYESKTMMVSSASPIIADRIVMLSDNPLENDSILLAEIDGSW